MLAVDTNVIAYLFLDGPPTAAARALLDKDSDWRSEDFALIEFGNVLTTAMRVRGLELNLAVCALADARRLIAPGLSAADDAKVLTLAEGLCISAYDARFLAVADRLGTRLVTEDTKLRRAAPGLTQSLAQALT